MRIFSNEYIGESTLDYSKWETFNGDYIYISNIGQGYIERCIDMLEWYMNAYPKHKNYPVWINYIKSLENELLERTLHISTPLAYIHKTA